MRYNKIKYKKKREKREKIYYALNNTIALHIKLIQLMKKSKRTYNKKYSKEIKLI